MEHQRDILGMLDLMVVPAFCVKDQAVLRGNAAAQGLLIAPGMPVRELVAAGWEEYAQFQGECLYLTISLSGEHRGAVVRRVDDLDVFILEQDPTHRELTALALAARELRDPLSKVMLSAEKLFPTTQNADAAGLNRGLYQLLRILGNMSDAGSFCAGCHLQTVNICAAMEEVFSKTMVTLAEIGVELRYQVPKESIYCLADMAQLERAVLNMISNAVKFSESQRPLTGELTRQDRTLRLSVTGSGTIPEELLPTLFTRYLRQPGLEDGRFGIGLGMVLIRGAAANHGGTVLIDHPEEDLTRITMTLAIRQNTATVFRSPLLHTDYSGERDHTLLELSDCLPSEFYDPRN